jgi:lipopolysaccharide export system protein LptC
MMAGTPQTADPDARARHEIGSGHRSAVQLRPLYSRFVGLMKLVLPLGAAALVGLVLAWPGGGGSDQNFSLSFANIRLNGDAEPGMTAARYLGTDDDRQPYVITAELVVPDGEAPDRFTLHTLQADMTLNSGLWMTLMAPRGIYDRAGNWLRLPDEVDIYSDQGFELHTRNALVDLAGSEASGDSPVEAIGPPGTLHAGGFRFVKEGERLFFLNGVRMSFRSGARQ